MAVAWRLHEAHLLLVRRLVDFPAHLRPVGRDAGWRCRLGGWYRREVQGGWYRREVQDGWFRPYNAGRRHWGQTQVRRAHLGRSDRIDEPREAKLRNPKELLPPSPPPLDEEDRRGELLFTPPEAVAAQQRHVDFSTVEHDLRTTRGEVGPRTGAPVVCGPVGT